MYSCRKSGSGPGLPFIRECITLALQKGRISAGRAAQGAVPRSPGGLSPLLSASDFRSVYARTSVTVSGSDCATDSASVCHPNSALVSNPDSASDFASISASVSGSDCAAASAAVSPKDSPRVSPQRSPRVSRPVYSYTVEKARFVGRPSFPGGGTGDGPPRGWLLPKRCFKG